MKVRIWHIILFLIISASISFLGTINNNNEKHSDACLALVDGSISSELQFDANKVWSDRTTYATVRISALAMKGIVDEGILTSAEIKKFITKMDFQGFRMRYTVARQFGGNNVYYYYTIYERTKIKYIKKDSANHRIKVEHTWSKI